MAQRLPDAWYQPQATGPVVRRSWKLISDARGPLLAGFNEFPWRDRVVQAKCTDTDPAFPSHLRSTLRVDRWHPSVPSPECTCGIYARDDPGLSLLERRRLRHDVLVAGFVRLFGRVLLSGPIYRAEQAEIIGPIAIGLPAPSFLRRRGGRWGVSDEIHRVTEDGDRWLFWFSGGSRGVPLGEWYRRTGEALRQRYAVEVVGLLPRSIV